jgi:3-hydroxyacyl-CoA dehydrogenase
VALIDASEDALQRGLQAVRRHYDDAARRGKLGEDEAKRRMAAIAGHLAFESAADSDLVIEAVFEDLALKQRVFSELDRITGVDAVLATNTSYLDIDKIAAATARPRSAAGLHFFSPANVMRLVEIVRGRETAPEVIAMLVAFARRLGKIPVVVGNCHGFVGNRMLRQRNIAAEQLLLEGAMPQEVDAAMVEFGFPMGPFAATDLAGLDIGWRMRQAIGARAEIADALCEQGRLGQKSGKGFYRYEPGSRTPLPDPDVDALIEDASRRLGIARRKFGNQEIVDRLLTPVIEEGRRILEEGIAARSSDIDVIWVHGYGWPVWRGGPMYYAENELKQRKGERHVETSTA